MDWMKKNWSEAGKKWFRRDNLIVLALAGVLLFVIALPVKDKGDEKGADARGQDIFPGADAAGGDGALGGSMDPLDYGRQQEERLKAILSSVKGVGKVEVMLTIASSEELVVEKDIRASRSDTGEEDSAGGKRNVAQTETGESTIYSTIGGDSAPYVIKTLNPKVEGVLVVAQGAGTGTVDRNITQIAQALFGVEAHKVKVMPMGD